MRPDIVPGARFPDYEIVDQTNTPRRLSELQGRDPMVLILSRGMFCPKDHQQHQDLAEFQNKLNPAISYGEHKILGATALVRRCGALTSQAFRIWCPHFFMLSG